MQQIEIENFVPVKHGCVDINKVTVFETYDGFLPMEMP
jgi:hypothetical protein